MRLSPSLSFDRDLSCSPAISRDATGARKYFRDSRDIIEPRSNPAGVPGSDPAPRHSVARRSRPWATRGRRAGARRRPAPRVLANNAERNRVGNRSLRGPHGAARPIEAPGPTGARAAVKSSGFRHSPIHRGPPGLAARAAVGCAPLARRRTCENTERFTCH